MMIKLKKRSSAVLIAVIVIIFGTLFGVHRSVNSETAKIEAQFYDGVYLKADKYTQPSIDSQLNKRAEAALGLLTVTNNYPSLSDEAQALRDARLMLLEANTIKEKYIANEKLEAAYQQIGTWLALQSSVVPESVQSYMAVLNGAEGVIKNSDYNRLVGEYRNSALGAFPVNILKNLAFVKYPEYFGVEG